MMIKSLLAAAVLLHPRPEIVVVEVLAGVVEHALVLAVARLDDLLEAHALEAGARQQLVQHVHVGLVMLVVMILERLGRHIGLKRIIGIRKLHQFEGHGSSPKGSRGKVAGKAKGSLQPRQASR